MKQNKEIQRDNTGVTTLVSNVIDIDKIPRRRSKSKPIKIMDSQFKNAVSAVRES